MEILTRLNSPYLVASFQRFCGVDIRDGDGKAQNGDATSANSGTSPTRRTDSVTAGNTGVKTRSRTRSNALNNSNNATKGNEQNGCVQNGHSNDAKPNVSGSRENGSTAPSETAANDGQVKYSVTNKFLYYLFVCGTTIGDEGFYCVLWTTWFWNFDGYVCRRVAYIWCFIMYIGQATKDVIRWPRPATPPVARMESRYELEYGMPSTHAMVGAAIPFSTFFLTIDRYQIDTTGCFLFCAFWCALVCLSRLYLGMHSVLDILAGLLYVALLVPIVFPYIDVIDNFINTHPYAPVFSVSIPLVMCLCYPSLEKWSTARGDTTIVMGVGAGVAVAMWLNYQYGLLLPSKTDLPHSIHIPHVSWLGLLFVRMLIGGALVAFTRHFVKRGVYRLTCHLLGLDYRTISKERYESQCLQLELPYKYITYMSMSIVALFMVPGLYRYLGIERPDARYEL